MSTRAFLVPREAEKELWVFPDLVCVNSGPVGKKTTRNPTVVKPPEVQKRGDLMNI